MQSETTHTYDKLVNGENVITKVKKIYYDNVLSKETHYNDKGEIHRDDGPAIIKYADDGISIIAKLWYKNNKRYRDNNEPSYEEYYTDTGRIKKQEWEKDGVLHRDPAHGPSYITFNEDGTLDEAFYFINGTEYPNYEIARINMMIQQLDTEDLKKCIAFINSLRKE